LPSDIAFSDDIDVIRIRGKAALRVGQALVWMEKPTQALVVGTDLGVAEATKIAVSMKPVTKKQWEKYLADLVSAQQKKSAAAEAKYQAEEAQRAADEKAAAVAAGKANGVDWFVGVPTSEARGKCFLFSVGKGRATLCKGNGAVAWRILPIGDELYVVAVTDAMIETVTVVDKVTNAELGRMKPTLSATQALRIGVIRIIKAQTPETEVAFGLDSGGTPVVGPLPLSLP
jgi:hypothetical protein